MALIFLPPCITIKLDICLLSADSSRDHTYPDYNKKIENVRTIHISVQQKFPTFPLITF